MGFSINDDNGEDLVNAIINAAFDQYKDCEHPALFAAAIVDEMLKRKSFHDMTAKMEAGMDMQEACDASDIPLLKEISLIVLCLADLTSFGGEFNGEEMSVRKKARDIRDEYQKKLTTALSKLNDVKGENTHDRN